jgi:sortase B
VNVIKWQAFKLPNKIASGAAPKRLRGRSELITKLTVILSVLILGIALFLVCIYGILPAVISNMGDKMDTDLAATLYERTITQEPVPQASAAEVFEQPEPEDMVLYPRDSFTTVLQDNPDVIGRITIDELDIAYLVLQTINNEYYLNHGYDRQRSKSGAIYLDYRCNIDRVPLKGHYILYGHNMKNGTMFHNLKKYAEEEFFSSNRMLRFDTLYEDYEWEVFSAYVTSTDFYYIETAFGSDEDWLEFINELKGKSLYQTDVTLSADDVVLTLSTCSYEFDGARFVVHARLIK